MGMRWKVAREAILSIRFICIEALMAHEAMRHHSSRFCKGYKDSFFLPQVGVFPDGYKEKACFFVAKINLLWFYARFL